MNDLVVITDGKAATTSLKVAEVFGKQHFHVMRDIRELDCSDDFRVVGVVLFIVCRIFEPTIVKTIESKR